VAYDALLIQDTGAVRTITLNRPDALNAFNRTLKSELADAVTAVDRDSSVRCLVITGAGRAFCAGQDLKEPLAADGLSIREMLRSGYNALILRLRSMEKPVIAAVNGVAAGAGFSLALACDLRIASETASFVEGFIRIGLVPDAGATYFLPRLVGIGRAMEISMTGDPVDAVTAVRIGLVSRVVRGDDLTSVTMDLAHRLANGPTRAIGLTKRALNRNLSLDLGSALDYEADMQELASRTIDFGEGVRAFVEKRPPRFVGG
jgi:2-(1,2-epoxy-1,2-dihydrophenyl)acetyl-CoA isomerase